MRRLLPIALGALVLGLFAAGRVARSELGVDFSPESVQAAVASLGWRGPVLFVGLVTFRQFLLLPSALILPVGGALFGALAGTALGAGGIVVSALLKYGVARGVGHEWLRPRFGAAIEAFQRRAEVAGPWLVGLVTAHPTGPMSPFHWGSGFARVPLAGFAIAVVLAAPIRAFAYSFFGSTLLDVGTPRFFLATALLAGVALLPFAHRGTRIRLLGILRRSAPARGAPAESGEPPEIRPR